jgi:hypothetical protein
MRRQAYQQVVDRFRGELQQVVPEGATVLVVGKGDPELLRLGSRRAWHFPQDGEGQYTGYHPADGASAVAQLERLKRMGATHLAFPQTTSWWLEHYSDLGDHLSRNYRSLPTDQGVCRVFDLKSRQEGPSSTVSSARPAPAPADPRLKRFVEELLPPGCSVVYVLPNAGLQGVGQNGNQGEACGAGLADLPVQTAWLTLQRSGARYAVLVRQPTEGFDRLSRLRKGLAQLCTNVAHREHLCSVFDLCSPLGSLPAGTPDPTVTPDGAPGHE